MAININSISTKNIHGVVAGIDSKKELFNLYVEEGMNKQRETIFSALAQRIGEIWIAAEEGAEREDWEREIRENLEGQIEEAINEDFNENGAMKQPETKEIDPLVMLREISFPHSIAPEYFGALKVAPVQNGYNVWIEGAFYLKNRGACFHLLNDISVTAKKGGFEAEFVRPPMGQSYLSIRK